jgi:hypothetical protein
MPLYFAGRPLLVHHSAYNSLFKRVFLPPSEYFAGQKKISYFFGRAFFAIGPVDNILRKI